VRAAQAVDLGVLYSTVSAGMLLARRYLTGRGIDQEFADRYGSAFGRTAAKIYRSANGAEPRRAWSLVSGKWRRVNGYLPTEADVLDEAFSTYKRTVEYVATAEPVTAPSPVELYNKEAGHFPAQFADITGETLRTMERASSTAAVEEFITSQLADLDTWQRHNERYDQAMQGDVDSAARNAIVGLPWDDPRTQALLTAERGQGDRAQAQDILNAAVVDWRYGSKAAPTPVIPEGCQIPGCNGTWHYDGTCVAELGELSFDDDSAVPVELVAEDGKRQIVAYAFDMSSLNLRREMTDRATARAFADKMRALADAIDAASAHLPAA
jgi:hypothetical protein